MKKSTAISSSLLPTDAVDGPGWTDVDSYYVSAKSDKNQPAPDSADKSKCVQPAKFPFSALVEKLF